MHAKNVVTRTVVGAVGGMMLVGLGTAAMAAYPDAEDSSSVDVNVEIEALEPEGALTMTVAADAATLTEEGSTEDYRQFTGELPDVTVSDTREVVPEGLYWYVTGQAGDFTGDDDQEPIGPDRLGWTPNLVSEDNGWVAPGDEVVTSIDESTAGEGESANNVGLVGEELLALALDSGEAAVEGSWTADAGLTLKTDVDVQPGSYTSLLTLSLFEDEA